MDYIYPCETLRGTFTVHLKNNRISRICFSNDKNRKHSSIPKVIKTLSADLDRYFQGENVVFKNYSIDLSVGTDFQKRVWSVLSKIPYGKTMSYSDVASQLGTKAIRATGTACGKNNLPIIIPCHRVISKNASLGGFSGGIKWKKFLLACEKNISTKSTEL